MEAPWKVVWPVREWCCKERRVVLLVPLKKIPLVPIKPHIDAKLLRCYFLPLTGAWVWKLAEVSTLCARHRSPATVGRDQISEASAATRWLVPLGRDLRCGSGSKVSCVCIATKIQVPSSGAESRRCLGLLEVLPKASLWDWQIRGLG